MGQEEGVGGVDSHSSSWDRTADGELFCQQLMHSHQRSRILLYGTARTVRFVIRCGSYIHTWRGSPRGGSLFPATTLWYFKAGAPIKMKEGGNNSPEEVATLTERDVKLLLPIKTTEVCVIGLLFFFCSPSSSLLRPPFAAHQHRDSCSLSTPHPCPSPV